LPRHRDAYLRLLEVERMARGGVPRQDPDAVAPLDPSSLVGRWQEACETLQELEERFPERDAFAAEICRDPRCRADAFIWRLLDRGLPDLAETAVLARLEAEGNPEGRKRNDYTTDLLAMCRAQSANAERVEGDACGAFEKLRRATRMLRPGGDPYVSGKVLSYFASACIALGKVELAEEALERALRVLDGNGFVAEAAKVTIKQAHLSTLQGVSPRKNLRDFLDAHEEDLRIPVRTIWMMKRSLVGSLLYHHNGEGAAALLASMPAFEPGSIEDLWKRYYMAMATLQSGDAHAASLQFADVAKQFLNSIQPDQGFVALLFQALSLFDVGNYAEAHCIASTAAARFSALHLYGGVAAKTAEQLLLCANSASLSRDTIENLIKVVISPAKKSPGRAPDNISD
jgi:ATP/maltotriose-dependent transcriptional regulator MalT